MGAATAYYLTQQTSHLPITILDAVGPGSCASGKAGAFLSSAWGDGTKREALFRKGFSLHKELALELNLKSFHPLEAVRVDPESVIRADGATLPEPDTWWPSHLKHETVPGPAAVVDPAELTRALFDSSLKSGAVFQQGSVKSLEMSDSSAVTSIEFEDGTSMRVEDDEEIIMAVGPWSSRLEDWLGKPLPVDGVLSSSMIFKGVSDSALGTALFCNEDDNGCHLEIFPRADSSLYISGLGGSEVLSPAVFRGPDCPDPAMNCTPNLSSWCPRKNDLSC